MSRRRILLSLTALCVIGAMVWLLLSSTVRPPAALDGGAERELLRIWCVSSVGGGESWLREQLRDFERQHPGVMTYLRTVAPEELSNESAVLPDLVLYTPGVLTAPQELFTPISGAEGLREPLLRCGRWQGQQYGLPLCYGAYVLCIDSAIEPHAAATPAPTTLLGRPAATPETSATPLPYPYEAALSADTPLAAPAGAGTFTLCCLLDMDQRPALEEGVLSAAEAYASFRSRRCATAMLTTGQVTAFASLTAAGKGFACRTMVPTEIITDQVWLGSIVQGAEDSAAGLLLRFLTGDDAQSALTGQSLHTALEGRRLYFSGVEAEVESAAARSLTALNAYVPAADAQAAAWQAYIGQTGISEALLPLL